MGGPQPAGCVGRTIDVGRGSVWLSNNCSDDGTARVVVDRKPADWQTLTPEEMAEFAVGLVQVLAEYGRGQGR